MSVLIHKISEHAYPQPGMYEIAIHITVSRYQHCIVMTAHAMNTAPVIKYLRDDGVGECQ